MEPVELDVRKVPPQGRHALIFSTFDSLAPGQALVLVSDHEPGPLRYRFQTEEEAAAEARQGR